MATSNELISKEQGMKFNTWYLEEIIPNYFHMKLKKKFYNKDNTDGGYIIIECKGIKNLKTGEIEIVPTA